MKKKLKQKTKEKNYFREIRAKKVRFKMDQQQMGNAKKGHNKMGRAKVVALVAPKRRASLIACAINR